MIGHISHRRLHRAATSIYASRGPAASCAWPAAYPCSSRKMFDQRCSSMPSPSVLRTTSRGCPSRWNGSSNGWSGSGVLFGRGPIEGLQVLPCEFRVRMLRPQRPLPDRQCPLVVRTGSSKISLASKKETEVVQASGSVRVLRTQNLLVDRQRPLVVWTGSRKISLDSKKETEVVQAEGGVRVLRTQNLLVDRQRPLVVRTGSRKIPLASKKDTEVVQAEGGVRVLRPQNLLPD